jgi:sugar phosphate isomerase/epimerase
LKFAFSSNAFRRYDLIETIRILAELGYQGIEILADIPHAYPPDLKSSDIEKIGTALENNGLSVSNLNAFMLHAIEDTYHPSWIEHDASKRGQRIDYTLQCIDLAAQLGIDILSTEPGGPLLGLQQQEGLIFFKEGLRAIYDKARDKGIRILIEPEPGLLIENSVQVRALLKDLDPEVFGLNFDIGHFFCVGEDPSDCIREMRDSIHHFHLEDIAATREHHHLLPGKGAIDFSNVFEAIEDIEYDGFITVELYPYEDQPIEAARQALSYLQAVACNSV